MHVLYAFGLLLRHITREQLMYARHVFLGHRPQVRVAWHGWQLVLFNQAGHRSLGRK